MVKRYEETDLEILVAGERHLVNGRGAQWEDGKGVVPTIRAVPDEHWNFPRAVALPFPFTLEQFKTFCAWHPYFEHEAIRTPFTNEDDTLDDDAIAELESRGEDAAELVRRYLAGDSDDEQDGQQPAAGETSPTHPLAAKRVPEVVEGAEQRQARRWQMCIDAALPMPQDTYAQLPRGINGVAKAEGITRQALAQDLNAHRERLFGK